MTEINGNPKILDEFLSYERAVRRLSGLTLYEYALDLQTFFKYLKRSRKLVDDEIEFDAIPVDDVDIPLLATVELTTLYEYLNFISTERPVYHTSPNTPYGDDTAAIARKISSLRTFFKYLTAKRMLLERNPAAELESPKNKVTLPRYLTSEEAGDLLDSVDGAFAARDYCILTLFLNCGLRVAELAALNRNSIHDDRILVMGKGSKERVLYLNEACLEALEAYLPTRLEPKNEKDKDALFVSRQLNRLGIPAIKKLVERHITAAGLGGKGYSAHKLRHTAATLMYQNGVDVRTLQEFLGHQQLDTTQIYTHLADESLREAADANPMAGKRRKKTVPNEKDA